MLRVVTVPTTVLGRVVLLPITPESVGLLAVHGVVADDELLLGHPERNHSLYGKADDGGDGDVPAGDEQSADDLLEELDAAGVAVEATTGVGDGEEEGAEGGLGKEAGREAADESGDGVGVEDAEGIVDVLEEL